MSDDSLPDYEPMLAAYHRAFSSELECVIRTLPIKPGSLILEMACGDGFYTPWLTELAGPTGRVVGADVSTSYLEIAQGVSREHGSGPMADFIAASIDRLPFPDQTFDAVWCAQSLFSLPEPVDALRKMMKTIKPGGTLSILEDDTLHQVLLPWPIDVELAVRAAEWEAFREASRHPDKFYVGRKLGGVFRDAGLTQITIRSFASSRMAPLEEPAREFLERYLDELRGKVAERLDPGLSKRFLALTATDSPECMLNQPDFQLTVIDHVVTGSVV